MSILARLIPVAAVMAVGLFSLLCWEPMAAADPPTETANKKTQEYLEATTSLYQQLLKICADIEAASRRLEEKSKKLDKLQGHDLTDAQRRDRDETQRQLERLKEELERGLTELKRVAYQASQSYRLLQKQQGRYSKAQLAALEQLRTKAKTEKKTSETKANAAISKVPKKKPSPKQK